MNGTFASLRNRNYRVYAAGGLVSNTGIWMQRVAQDWLVLQLTDNSASALGIAIGLQFIPTLTLSPFAGVLIDRLARLRVLLLTTGLLGLLSALIGTLAVLGVADLWHIYTLILVFGMVTAFEAPARQAFVSEIVAPEQVVNAVGLNSVSFNVARLLGPALSGLLIGALGSGSSAAGWVIIVTAGTYGAVLAALLLMDRSTMRIVPPVARQPGQLREGIRYVRQRPDMMVVLIVVCFCGAFGLNFGLSSAVMATEVFGKGASEFGVLGSTLAMGSLLGALLGASRAKPNGRFVAMAACAFAAALVIAGTLPSYTVFVIWSPIVGFLALTVLTAANATMQLGADDQHRARVMALYLTLLLGGAPIGSPLLGFAADHIGPRIVLLGGGAMVFAGVLLAWAVAARTRTGSDGHVATDRGSAGSATDINA